MLPPDLEAAVETDRLCLSRPWSESVWREELESPLGLYLLLEVSDGPVRHPVGHVGLKLIVDEAHVMTIAVRPAHRREGHARTLIRAALGLAAEKGAFFVHLEVRPSNAPARALYGSLGFVETGRRKRYYGDEDALLLTLDLGVER